MEDETILKAMSIAHESQEGQAEVAASAPATAPAQVSAETVVEQPADAIAPVEVKETPPAETPSSTEAVSAPYNYWPDLETKTEGLVKDEESLLSALQRVKSYDALVQEKEELAKNSFKPANDYIAKLNELALAGANPDQVKAFVKLNGYGDLETLSPIELKVTKMVLTEGYSEDIARKLVNRQFDLTQFDEGDPAQKEEADIMREQLRVSAKADLEALKQYRAELSVVPNPEKEDAEKAQLKQIADMSAYNQTVEAQAVNIAKHFPEKLTYEFKIGEETVSYEDSFDKQFLEKDVAAYVKEYFKDSMDPITPETVTEAYSFALGEYLKVNDAKRLEKAYQKGFTAATEQTINKYENKSGLPKAKENQVVVTNEAGLSAFMREMVGR